jgi:hypothetical protein
MDYPEPDNDLTLPVAWPRDLRSVGHIRRRRDGGDDGVGGPLAEVGILAQVIELRGAGRSPCQSSNANARTAAASRRASSREFATAITPGTSGKDTP